MTAALLDATTIVARAHRMGITSLERARRELEHARNDLGGHRLWPFR